GQGSKFDGRAANVADAGARLNDLPGTRVIATSRVEETAPIGPVAQGPYLNQMVLVDTSLSPEELLAQCRKIEAERGRERRERWGPRTLDLDIVRYGSRTIREPNLTIPHPELPHRDFWRREIAELEAAAPRPTPDD